MRREEREGEEGEEDEKRIQRGDSAPRSSLFFVPVVMPLPYCRFSSFANWLSMWFVLSAPALFSPISIHHPPFLSSSSLQVPFHRPHLLARVINDLTDTLNEQCFESVKQVVIKADAASPFAVGRQQKGREERRNREREREVVKRESVRGRD